MCTHFSNVFTYISHCIHANFSQRILNSLKPVMSATCSTLEVYVHLIYAHILSLSQNVIIYTDNWNRKYLFYLTASLFRIFNHEFWKHQLNNATGRDELFHISFHLTHLYVESCLIIWIVNKNEAMCSNSECFTAKLKANRTRRHSFIFFRCPFS